MEGLYCDDYKNILKQLPDNSVDLIITDPPYKTTKRGISKNTRQIFCKLVKQEFYKIQ